MIQLDLVNSLSLFEHAIFSKRLVLITQIIQAANLYRLKMEELSPMQPTI